MPTTLLVGLLVVLPAGIALFRSMYRWVPSGISTFVGLENFRSLADSDLFVQILKNHAFYLLGLPIWILLPLIVAFLLSEKTFKPNVFRMILLFPSILSPAIVGILFRGILADNGTLNGVLEAIGLSFLSQNWLGDGDWVKLTLIGVITWAYLGLGVFIYSSAILAISPSHLEAADVDGATWWQKFRNVVMPGVAPTIAMWGFFQLIAVFLSIFPWIYVLTNGGPAYASVTFDYAIYNAAIRDGRFGLASAMAVVLIVIIGMLVLTAVLFRAIQRVRVPLRGRPNRVKGRRKPKRSASGIAKLRGRIRDRRRSKRLRWGPSPYRTAAFVGISIVYLSPFLFLVNTAIKTREDYLVNRGGLTRSFTLDHLVYAWDTARLGRAMANSLIPIIVAVPLTVILGSAASFWFMRHHGKVARRLKKVLIGVAIVPFIVYMIPLFLLLADLRIVDNLPMLGVIYAAVLTPFALYLIGSYSERGIPHQTLEAAVVDGAGLWTQFRAIYLPLARPVIGTLATIAALVVWGDLIISVVLVHDPAKVTAIPAAAGIQAQQMGGAFSVAVQESAAASLIVVLPLLLVFLVGQRAFTRGLVAGAEQ